MPEVASVYTVIGNKGEPNQGTIHVKLNGYWAFAERVRRTQPTAEGNQINTNQVKEKLRQQLPTLPGVSISIEDIPFINTEAEKPLQIALLGKDLTVLQQTANQLKAKVDLLPGFIDTEITGIDELEIKHLNEKRVVYFNANLENGKAVGNATAEVISIAQSLIPEGVSLDRWGESAHSSDVLSSFLRTLVFAIILMLIVLTLPFGRLLEPIVVILSLPLAIIGAMLALLFTQSEFGMISLIGLIFLLGLLDKNALLLMDYVNQLRQKGLKRTEAILETGVVRLRPILMTTASTILGMLPIALGWGTGAELRQPMAVAIIGGLITSTLLSLIVVPVLYTLLEDGWKLLIGGRDHTI